MEGSISVDTPHVFLPTPRQQINVFWADSYVFANIFWPNIFSLLVSQGEEWQHKVGIFNILM